MPKVRREKSQSMDCSGSYPYPSSSKNLELPRPRFGSADDWKEWDNTRCSICMETPHNTVLLKCSSYEKGCRPYMCNTSYRHSNCLDQFCKSFGSHLSSVKLEEIPLTSTVPHDRKVQSELGNPSQSGNQLQPKLICPLCRGGLYGYMVSEPARRYMNFKQRTCSCETCEFQGTYSELRKHARLEHPSVRPSEVDLSRQCDWLQMEQQRDFEDLFSSINASSDAEYSREEYAVWAAGGLADMMSMLVSEIFSSDVYVTISDPMPSQPLRDRRSETLHGVSNYTQTNQSARRRSFIPSPHQGERIERGGLRSTFPSTHELETLESIGWTPISPSSHDLEANYTDRWRENIPPSRMDQAHSEIVESYYYTELRRGRTSSTRMPQVSQVSHTNPRSNNYFSSSPDQRTQRRNQGRWSTFDSDF